MEVQGNGILVVSDDPKATERAAQVIADVFSMYKLDTAKAGDVTEVNVSGVSYFVKECF